MDIAPPLFSRSWTCPAAKSFYVIILTAISFFIIFSIFVLVSFPFYFKMEEFAWAFMPILMVYSLFLVPVTSIFIVSLPVWFVCYMYRINNNKSSLVSSLISSTALNIFSFFVVYFIIVYVMNEMYLLNYWPLLCGMFTLSMFWTWFLFRDKKLEKETKQ